MLLVLHQAQAHISGSTNMNMAVGWKEIEDIDCVLGSSACSFPHLAHLSSPLETMQAHLSGSGNMNVVVGRADGRRLKTMCTIGTPGSSA